MADVIEYGKEIWETDAQAAFAEAKRRVEICGREGEEWLFLSDLYALKELPESLTELTHLKRLSIGATRGPDRKPYFVPEKITLSDWMPLSALTALEQLDLARTNLSTLIPIAECTQLSSLDCHKTQITDLSPIAKCTQLSTLYCSSSQITDLSPIAKCTELSKLYCFDTQITDISPIAKCTQLSALYCNHTQITDLSPIAKCTQLSTLYCSYTRITDIAPIAKCTQLSTLDCSGTQITDLLTLLELPAFRNQRATLAFVRTPAAQASATWTEIAALAEYGPTGDCANAAVAELLRERDGGEAGAEREGGAAPAPDKPFLFLSYAKGDQKRAGVLQAALAADGVPIWWDQALETGDKWRAEIEQRVDAAAAVMVLWTPQSTKRDFVISEAHRGLKAGKLLPVRLTDCALPMEFDQVQAPDLSHWAGDRGDATYRRILRQVRLRLGLIEKAGEETQALAALAAGLEAGIGPDGRVRLEQFPADQRLPMEDDRSLAERVAAQKENIQTLLDTLTGNEFNAPSSLMSGLELYLATITVKEPVIHAVEPRWDFLEPELLDEDTRGPLRKSHIRLFDRILKGHPPVIQAIDKTPEAPPPAIEINPDAVPVEEVEEISEGASASFNAYGEAAGLDDSFGAIVDTQRDVLRATRDVPYGETPEQEGRRKARRRDALLYLSGALGVAANLTTVSGYTATEAYNALSALIAQLFERLAPIFF